LSVILGGCGVRLDELTPLYMAFARQGQFASANWLQDESEKDSVQLLSAASSYLLSEMLTTVARPDLPLQWQNSSRLPRVAWKTGTSYGRKDAWSVGYNRHFTVGVWVGNFSGEGVPGLNGSASAAPLLFQIFNHLDYDKEKTWFPLPADLTYREVCSESGLLPASWCKNRITDAAIPGISPYHRCQHLREVYIAPDSSIAYCMSCLPDSGFIKALYPNHKPEMLSYLRQGQINVLTPPEHNPDCERVFADGAPNISSPVDGLTYYVNPRDSASLKLACDVSSDVHTVFWYVNDRLVKKTSAAESFFIQPEAGDLKISCSDDRGRNSDVFIRVKQSDF
ncbi:MAG: penicillin-binding protein 1C, partial [Bacteroidota bacterium]